MVSDAPIKTGLTADDLAHLSMNTRHELVEGKLIKLTPTKLLHGIVTNRISFLLNQFNAEHKVGTILAAETGFFTRGNKRTVRAPDVALISYHRLPAESLPQALADYVSVAPDLVVEVVSPNDKADEIEQKVREWLNFGVAVVWVVYPTSRRVHIHSGDQSRILDADDMIDGGEALPGFEAPVSAFFEA